MTERGTGSAVRAFRGNAGDGILRVHIVSRKVPRVLCFRSLAGIPAKTVPQRTKKGPQLVRNLVRPFGRLHRSGGSSRFRLGFGAIELAHDVGADGPRSDLGRRRLLALAVRPLVGRANEFAFDEDMRAFLDRGGHMLGQPRTKYHNPMPLGLEGPFALGGLPGALCGDGKNGEFRTAVPRLALLRVGTNKPDESYRVYYVE